MKSEFAKIFGVGAAVLFGSFVSFSADDVDLSVNSDFRGAEVGAAIAPGWAVDEQGGTTRIVRDAELDQDEFALQVSAPAGVVKTICTDYFPVQGKILKLDLKLKGRGSAAFGFFAFDAQKNRIEAADAWEAVALQAPWAKLEKRFELNDSKVAFVRIGLLVEPESEAFFSDVDAEFLLAPIARTAAPSVPVPPALPQNPVQASTVQQAPALPPSRPLGYDKFYFLREIGDAPYAATIPVGSDIEFELQEDSPRGFVWQIESYDAGICRVKIDHDRDRDWWGRIREKAEIELKGVAPGTATVVFTAQGKRFIVLLTVK